MHLVLVTQNKNGSQNDLHIRLRQAFDEYPTMVVVAFMGIGVSVFTIKLLSYHLMIIFKSMTTYENLKAIYGNYKMFPFIEVGVIYRYIKAMFTKYIRTPVDFSEAYNTR